jgi:hypothetical protein
MSHGLVWDGALKNIIDRIGRGMFGRVCTPQAKYKVEETWESISRTLNEDDNTVSLRTAAGVKRYDLERIEEVVSMVKDRFDGIPETTFETKSEFEKTKPPPESTEKLSEEVGRKVSGKKHGKEPHQEGEESYSKKQQVSGGAGGWKQSSGTTFNPTDHPTKGTGKGGGDVKAPWLCIYNLKFQFIDAKDDCLKVGNCGRQHFDKAKKGKKDYYWTLQTLTEQVERSSEKVTSKEEKKKLITALKKEFP